MTLSSATASASKNFHDHLLPQTFEARGATVAFTTPVLAHARVRKDWRGRLELVIIGFAGGAGDYVLPWPAVGDLVSMTAHDTLLHQELLERTELDPDDVRQAALEVAKTGLAGPDVGDAARRALIEDDQAKTVNEAVLILSLIEKVEPARTQELAPEIMTPTGQARIRETFSTVAGQLDLNRSVFDRLLPQLSRSSYTIGPANTPAPGRVRQSLQRLDGFRASIAAWGGERLGVAAEQAAVCTAVATQTLGIATAVLREFERAIASPEDVVAHWEVKVSPVEHLVRRLAWLVDGWGPIAEIWFGATDLSQQIDAIAEVVPVLPLLPRDEAVVDPRRATVAGARERGQVRASEDWRTGEPDPEIVKRLEAVKAKTI